MSDDEKLVRRMVEEKAAALRARDPQAMVAGYAPEATRYTLAPPLRQPGDARDPGPVARWLTTFTGPMDLEIRDLDVHVSGDVAFCTALACLTATTADTAETFHLWHRLTLGLRKLGDGWRVVHEHESVPFEMDGSMRASVGLQP
jgi:ketosteroid isomerase-like protein